LAPPEDNGLGEGQPMPPATAEAAVYPFESGFFTDEADRFAQVPDVGSVIGVAPRRVILGIGGFAVEYATSDNVALENIGKLLESADFHTVEGVNADLRFDKPPEPGDAVYLRNADSNFVGLRLSNGTLTVGYGQQRSYRRSEGDAWIEIDKTKGGDGSGYTGPLFDRSLLDAVVERYAALPDPQGWNDWPAANILIEAENLRVTYLFNANDPDVRAESFRLTLEAAGFTADSVTAAEVLCSKDAIQATYTVETGPLPLSPAQVYTERCSYEVK
jgi:hypothetical protein